MLTWTFRTLSILNLLGCYVMYTCYGVSSALDFIPIVQIPWNNFQTFNFIVIYREQEEGRWLWLKIQIFDIVILILMIIMTHVIWIEWFMSSNPLEMAAVIPGTYRNIKLTFCIWQTVLINDSWNSCLAIYDLLSSEIPSTMVLMVHSSYLSSVRNTLHGTFQTHTNTLRK